MAKQLLLCAAWALGCAPGLLLACNGTATQDSSPDVTRPDLHGIAVFLPQLLENNQTSPFAELLNVVARHYKEGKISFSIEPVKRVYMDTSDKNADFRFPIMKLREGADDATPYQFTKEMLGKVTFVLYTHKNKPLDREDVLRMANLAKYDIEAPPVNWGFPSKSVVNLELSLKKLNLGRVDGVLWAQEEADLSGAQVQTEQYPSRPLRRLPGCAVSQLQPPWRFCPPSAESGHTLRARQRRTAESLR
ncbi:hypothetical protein JOS77_02695 [Chromobacterium haemolyticum]|nr:hypothetical protein JOS77_02695 [Chromobacterium haemolyticum]